MAALMLAASIATAAPAQAAQEREAAGPWDCATGIDAGTRGSTVRARCNYGSGWYRVSASCLRADGSGLRYTAVGDWYAPGSGYWSTYYPCRYPRSVEVDTIGIG
ncbi:hypothetical protein [Kribbella sp. CA-294648]|uniref:hypothetical protein n=1 Tax=Kribbella sp. CA-294648 TaxID=3239948 RepID=UPI003D8BEFFF